MSVKIHVDGEDLQAVETFEIVEGGRLKDLVVHVAEKTNAKTEGLLLFVEDKGGVLDLEIFVHEYGDRHKIHHVHHCREVEVIAYYGKETATHIYPPSIRIQKILDWAVSVKKFNIDPTIALEMQLSLHGTEAALPAGAHIGRYAKHGHCTVELDLTRGDIHQGQS